MDPIESGVGQAQAAEVSAPAHPRSFYTMLAKEPEKALAFIEGLEDSSADETGSKRLARTPRESWLHAVARRGDAACSRAAMARAKHKDAPETDCGASPLLEAASSGNLEAAVEFLAGGADPWVRDRDGLGFLHSAVFGGEPALVELALSFALTSEGEINRVSEGDDDLLEALGQKPERPEPDPDETRRRVWSRRRWEEDDDDDGWTEPDREELFPNEGLSPLGCALEAGVGDGAILRRLVEAGADPKAFDAKGRPALAAAAEQGSAVAVRTLLELGGDPNESDAEGASALALAARNGRVAAFEALLEAGADPDFKGERKQKWRGHGKSAREEAAAVAGRFPGISALLEERELSLATAPVQEVRRPRGGL